MPIHMVMMQQTFIVEEMVLCARQGLARESAASTHACLCLRPLSTHGEKVLKLVMMQSKSSLQRWWFVQARVWGEPERHLCRHAFFEGHVFTARRRR